MCEPAVFHAQTKLSRSSPVADISMLQIYLKWAGPSARSRRLASSRRSTLATTTTPTSSASSTSQHTLIMPLRTHFREFSPFLAPFTVLTCLQDGKVILNLVASLLTSFHLSFMHS